jgi:hypothetical protein
MPDEFAEAMIELNGSLEICKDAGVTKAEALAEVENVYKEE